VIENESRVDSAKGFLLMHDADRGIVAFGSKPAVDSVEMAAQKRRLEFG
jgi:hypothetical protein